MIISIDNRDLPYSIDSYGMFTGDGVEDMEFEYLREEAYPELKESYPHLQIGFDYDHPAIVKELTGWSIALIEQAAHNEKWLLGLPMVKEIRSPQFYNYTTDWYVAEWNIDVDELNKVIPENWKELAYQQNWTNLDDEGEETQIVAKISVRLLELLDVEEYNSVMWEHESECYYEHMKPDEETQKVIDIIEKARDNV